MEGAVNLPVPQEKSLVPQWYPELLDAVSDKIQTGRRRAFAAVRTDFAFVQRSAAQIVQVRLAQFVTRDTHHLSTSNSRRPINAR